MYIKLTRKENEMIGENKDGNVVGTQEQLIRTFSTGATRDTDKDKLDYEGFLSPLVLKRFAEYMHKCRVQSDGNLRDSDNWQHGIPQDVYMKSMWRHFIEVWMLHRKWAPLNGLDTIAPHNLQQEALCALMFNTMGYLHELLKDNK